jgi:hypothetical protein
MLIKDGERYKLSNKEIDEIKKKYRNFPVELKYPKSRVKPSLSKHNKLPDKPNSISFPYTAVRKTEKGTELWVYAESMNYDNNGKPVYLPKNLYFNGHKAMMEDDIELIWWLINICPFLENGLNFNGRVAKCVIEDLENEAEKKAEKRQADSVLSLALYHPKLGLPESKLRQIAQAYFIKGIDKLSLAQVKLAIEMQVSRDKVNGVQKFLDMSEADQIMNVRANLQQAIDREIIVHAPIKKSWSWVTAHGEKNIPIFTVTVGSDPNESLYEYYMSNVKFANELMSKLKGFSSVKTNFEDKEIEEDNEEN